MAENARQPDITAILTAHEEGSMVGVSFRSMLAAVRVATEAGLDVEMLVVLDEPDEATREMLAEVNTHGARLLEVSCGDQGPVRNHAVRESRGRFIAFLDGDDLWTENWLVAAHALCAAEPRTIAHPYADWVFGEGRSLSFPPDQTDPQFDPATLRVTNAWDALCLAPREAYLDHPFQARALAQGYAFEDWLWNLHTVQAGYVHRVVRDTIHFKRSRSGSQFRHASASRSLTGPTSFQDYAWLQEWEAAREKEPGTGPASSPLTVSVQTRTTVEGSE
jgi:glycosyltransferase involved in cell wall biosynthesis